MRLVVSFHVDNVAPKNILVKFLASKHNSEGLFLNLSYLVSVWVRALDERLTGCCN